MKINANDQIPKHLNPVTPKKNQPSRNESFGNILKAHVNSATPEVAGTQLTAFVNPLNNLKMDISAGFDPNDAIDRTENLIGLLDQYRHKLADPSATLKQIDPIVREIDQEAEILTLVLDTLPDNEGIKRIINETLVTASTEVTKFYRGDYI